LLFYALWHAHHIDGADAEGDVAEVLNRVAEPRWLDKARVAA
jgi:hypothetical protein